MRYIFLLIISVLFLSFAGNDKEKKKIDKALACIDTSGLMQTVHILSSDSLQGRLPGSDEYNKAAKYALTRFSNLIPFVADGYFQNFNIEYNDIFGPVEFVVFDSDKTKHELIFGKDYVCRGFTGSGKIYAPVVFCGYGLSYPEIGYDDYASVDVKGKIVILFKQNPSWTIPRVNWPAFSIRTKAKTAFEHGASAVLFVPLPNSQNPQRPIGSMMDGEGDQLLTVPQLQISIETADVLLKSNKQTIKSLQSFIDSTEIPLSIELECSAFIEVQAKYYKEKPTMNIVGKLEGSDPLLKDEYVILGAHLDHVGSQAGKIIFPGANDNASGSAAVMQIAEAYNKSKIKPKRTILFVLFACEEHHLDGAEFLAANLNIPVEKIVTMINLDCIAFGDSIHIGGGKSAPVLYQIAKDLDNTYTKLMINNTWYGGGADAQPFFDKGIPTLYFASKNSYAHLHLPSDKPETLNQELFKKITQLAFLTSYEIVMGRYKKEEIKKPE